MPFLTVGRGGRRRRTRSDSHCRSHSSAVRSPCRKAIRSWWRPGARAGSPWRPRPGLRYRSGQVLSGAQFGVRTSGWDNRSIYLGPRHEHEIGVRHTNQPSRIGNARSFDHQVDAATNRAGMSSSTAANPSPLRRRAASGHRLRNDHGGLALRKEQEDVT